MVLAAKIGAIVGAEHLLTGADALAFYATDLVVWDHASVPALVSRPGTVDEVAAIARLARDAGVTLIPRGAGLSYTGGVVASDPDAIVLDVTRLDGIEIDAANLVARVGAGATWLALAGALAGTGLRPSQLGPISGEHSTIGGAVSQNVPGNLEGVLGLELVLADGEIVRTGAASLSGVDPFYRYFGPDMTGLFCGDCGAFGIKTAIYLRLVRERPAEFASFSFETPGAVIAAMARLGAAGLGVRLFGMDPQKIQDVAKVDAGTGLGIVLAMARKSRNPLTLARDLVRLGRAPRRLATAGWTLHVTAEAPTAVAAHSILGCARDLIDEEATEIDNVLPKALHAKPYSVRGFLGRQGERWVPIHGMVSLAHAVSAMTDLQAYFAQRSAVLTDKGIAIGYFLSSVGPYVSMEPMFYWRDALSPIHLHYLSERNRERFSNRTPDPDLRALVATMRADIRAIFRGYGASHAQLARYYAYLDRLEHGAQDLSRRIKQALDPQGIMNRGALGF